jgi:methionyl-tRNA formyltransferase
VQLFDSRRGAGSRPVASPGTVLDVSAEGIEIAADGGSIVVKRVRPQGGAKVAASEWAAEAGVTAGEKLGG